MKEENTAGQPNRPLGSEAEQCAGREVEVSNTFGKGFNIDEPFEDESTNETDIVDEAHDGAIDKWDSIPRLKALKELFEDWFVDSKAKLLPARREEQL